MAYDVLGILLTDQCNFSCRHCCNESGSHGSVSRELDGIKRAIIQAGQNPDIKEVGFSGGEPFLFFKRLLYLAQLAHDNGLSVSVTSNGYWASSDERAWRMLSELQQAGLRCLNISVSPYHLEFTTRKKLMTAASASLDVGLITRVNVVTTSHFSCEDARAIFGNRASAIEFVPMPLIPTGRAADQIPVDEFRTTEGIPSGNCKHHFTKLALDADGDAFPCCSPGGFTPPLKLGNIANDSLDALIERVQNETLFNVLSTVGPAYFAPFIKEELGDTYLTQSFVDQCHLCHSMMSDSAMRHVVEGTVARLDRELSELSIQPAP